MGTIITRLSKKFCSKSRVTILMVGLDGSGKTTILYKLKLGEMVTSVPTIGFNVGTVEFKNMNMSIWDVGGQKKIRPLWKHYFQNLDGLIFVVDSNDRERITEARNELHRILGDRELNDVKLLIFANKQDYSNAMDVDEIAHKLGLHALFQRCWYIQIRLPCLDMDCMKDLIGFRIMFPARQDDICFFLQHTPPSPAPPTPPAPTNFTTTGALRSAGVGRIIDISHRYRSDMPSWLSSDGLGQFLWLRATMKNGSQANNSEMKLPAHTGTHVDAPGPALLIDVPRHSNITADVMKSLNIPKGVRLVLFRTLITDRKLMFKTEFDTSYVGFTKDGAKWLVDNTDIKLVGLDYLSVAAFSDLVPAHHGFLESREIILVEGLKLDAVLPGLYSVHCLPLRLLGAEGSPIRCILIK